MVHYHHQSDNAKRSKFFGNLERNLNFSWNDIVFHRSKHQKIQNTIRVSNGNGNLKKLVPLCLRGKNKPKYENNLIYHTKGIQANF